MLHEASEDEDELAELPVAGEWTNAASVVELLAERIARRGTPDPMWEMWQVRSAFDVWHRHLRRTNRAIFGQLYRVSTFEKGRSAKLRSALLRWIAVCDQLRKRQLKKLQEVCTPPHTACIG